MFDCAVGDDSLVMHNATVRKITVPDGKVIPDGMAITEQHAVENLENIPQNWQNLKTLL